VLLPAGVDGDGVEAVAEVHLDAHPRPGVRRARPPVRGRQVAQ
jgi:hypothetical protein